MWHATPRFESAAPRNPAIPPPRAACYGPRMSPFLRHIEALSTPLPAPRLAFAIGDAPVGWLSPALADALARLEGITRTPTGLRLDDGARLHGLARALADQGHMRWRNEAFDVRATPTGPVLGRIDRGALPAFGIEAQGIHLDGLVRRADGLHIWIARRAATKSLDPNKLDHIVAGGIPAGLGPAETLVKEAAEEAAIPAALAALARPAGAVRYAMARPEGLRRDLLHCYELDLPADFTPRAADGEVAGFELWPLAAAFAAVRDTDDFKFNVNLVLIRLFLRHGLFSATETEEIEPALRRVSWAQ